MGSPASYSSANPIINDAYRIYREILAQDMTDHTETDLAGALALHLRMIEAMHGIRIRNAGDVIRRLAPALQTSAGALSAGITINTWVATSGASGDITVPEDVLFRILLHLNTRNEQE